MGFDWYEDDDSTLAGTDYTLSTTAGIASSEIELHAWLNKGSSVGSPETRYLRLYVEDSGTWRTSGLDVLDRREIEARIVGSQNPDAVPGFSVSTTAWRPIGTRRTLQLPAIYPNCCIEVQLRINPTNEGGASSPVTFRVRAVQGTQGDVPISIPDEVTVDGPLDMGGERITGLPLVTVATDGADACTVDALRSGNAKPAARLMLTDADDWPDLVTNGGFDSDLSDWSGTNWAQSSGTALHTAGATDPLVQSLAIVEGVTYRVRFTVSGRTAGNVTPSVGAVSGTAEDSDGVKVAYILADDSGALDLGFTPSSDFDGALDDISCEALLYGLTTADGESVLDADRVLVWLSDTPHLSGRYLAVDGGAWTRHPDSANHYLLNAGALAYIREGATAAKSLWVQTLALADIATDPQEWLRVWQAP